MGSGDGNEGRAEAAIRSLIMGGRFDRSEKGAFEKEAESQKVSTSAAESFTNSRHSEWP